MRQLFLSILLLGVSLSASADFLSELPGSSVVIGGYVAADSVSARLASMPLCPLEGLWQMADDGALFAIERADAPGEHAPRKLRLVMVRPSWRSIRPGTVFGHAVPTARPGVYEARLYSELGRRVGLGIPRRFTLELASEGRMLTFKPFKSPVRINLFRLLPYLYRRVVTPQQSRPDGLDGAVKLFPQSAGHPLTPVYL